jgi:hypothetical protein
MKEYCLFDEELAIIFKLDFFFVTFLTMVMAKDDVRVGFRDG